MKKETNNKEEVKKQPIRMKGKYIQTVGKRKRAMAIVRVYKTGSGQMTINHLEDEYFTQEQLGLIKQPIKQAGQKEYNISIVVSGGGKKCQAEAARHAISKALIEIDKELRPAMKAKGWLTRDARKKERKKPGLKKARKAPQWAKR